MTVAPHRLVAIAPDALEEIACGVEDALLFALGILE
jgi:hypothetical protein